MTVLWPGISADWEPCEGGKYSFDSPATTPNHGGLAEGLFQGLRSIQTGIYLLSWPDGNIVSRSRNQVNLSEGTKSRDMIGARYERISQ